MKTFEQCAAQGDVMFTRVDSLPEGLVEFDPVNGEVIVAHSETGHNHVMKSEGVKMYQSANDNFTAYLVVNNDTPLIHMRGHDTHEALMFKQGIYRVKRQREYTPEGWRKAQD